MVLGKLLRLRRIFANGRALIVPLDHGLEGPIPLVRMLARSAVDAVTLSPGVLERVAEDIGGLAVILRLNGAGQLSGSSRAQRLASVRGAVELGAEAIEVLVDVGIPDELDRLGVITEQARRWGMPVIANVLGEHLEAAVEVAAEYGADAIHTDAAGAPNLRHMARGAGRPVLVSLDRMLSAEELFHSADQCLEAGVQGIVVHGCTEPVLNAMHSLLHQGVSVEQALARAG